MMRTSLRYSILACLSIGMFYACGSASTDSGEKDTTRTEEPAQEGAVMRKDSELALLMREIESQFEAARPFIVAGDSIPDSLNFEFESMYTAQQTDPKVQEDPMYEAMSRVFLKRVETLLREPTPETYNWALKACVACHESHCPGPIQKIKRLQVDVSKDQAS